MRTSYYSRAAIRHAMRHLGIRTKRRKDAFLDSHGRFSASATHCGGSGGTTAVAGVLVDDTRGCAHSYFELHRHDGSYSDHPKRFDKDGCFGMADVARNTMSVMPWKVL